MESRPSSLLLLLLSSLLSLLLSAPAAANVSHRLEAGFEGGEPADGGELTLFCTATPGGTRWETCEWADPDGDRFEVDPEDGTVDGGGELTGEASDEDTCAVTTTNLKVRFTLCS